MEETVKTVLGELEEWGLANDARESERSKRMLNLEPDTAQLIGILIRSGAYKQLLEIGTSNGYSTIWLAWAARETGGRVTSIEQNPAKLELAEANLKRAGLREFVELHQGDATQIISELTGPFDLVFFDAHRESYPVQLALVLPRLTQRALLLADNVHSHPDEIAGYLEAMSARQDEFDHVVVGVGKGLSVAYRQARTISSV